METYLVGGAVRDQILGISVYDRDWVVVGSTAEEMVAAGYQPVGKDFPVFLHPKTKEEYALARTERKSGHGYKGFEFHASPDVTLEEDLRRRDLTINAMAKSESGELIDPFNGQQDIASKTLRHVSDAFVEDPLRVLRVARFSARFHHLGFTLAPETLALMQQLSEQGEIAHLTKERVWQELYRALGERSPEVFFQVLNAANALQVLMPEISQKFEKLSEASHLLEETSLLKASGSVQSDAELRFALLCYQTNLSENELDALFERINATKQSQRCCQLICQQLDNLLHYEEISAEEKLALYKHLDPLRRPENLQWIGQAIEVKASVDSNVSIDKLQSQLQQLISSVESVKPADIVAEGFSGKALGNELKQRQLKAIESNG